MQLLGDTRDDMAMDVCTEAERIANKMKGEDKPFYIVHFAKADRNNSGVIRQTFKMYHVVPKGIIGLLVWYVDNAKGIFKFCPELSSPPDVPVDPQVLSDRSEDFSERVAKQGKEFKILTT